ncbi:hypothetical protein ACJIZ3_009465 [Penstemon smallii]|uniref:Cytochrome P450 n=1 Tax=Penstemon smallii TaxID=265156 RepID=A0ABD3TCK5_9LAMI
MAVVLYYIVGLIVLGVSHLVYKWRNPKCNGVLPPGSMGLPFIGESLQYFSPQPLEGIPPFLTKRIARYGPLFRTSFLGQRVIVSIDPVVNQYIFRREGYEFRSWYTSSAVMVLGSKGINSQQGDAHKYLRNLTLEFIGPENLKVELGHEMDINTRHHLASWACGDHEVDIKEELEIMVFKLAAKKWLDFDEQQVLELRDNYTFVRKAFLSMPFGIPGTALHAALQEIEDEGTILTEEFALDMVYILLFAAVETVSTSMALCLKFLHEHPKVLEELKVINETLRLADIAPGMFRKVMQDGQELHHGTRKFMAFGGGRRLCAGSDFAKLQMAIFIHYLVTKYRYGPLFRTSFLGQRVIVSIDPEVNQYIFRREGKEFQCWYTSSAAKILGSKALNGQQGDVHKYLRNLVVNLIGPENLKVGLGHETDINTRHHLASWACRGHEVDLKEELEIMVFKLAAKKLLDFDEQQVLELRDNYKCVRKAFLSMPFGIPGTALHAALQGRKKAKKMIKGVFNARRMSKDNNLDFIGLLLKEIEDEGTILTEEFAMDMVYTLLFAAVETVTPAMALCLKYLHEHPKVLEELKVINETVRLADIAPGMFRKVMQDVNIKGKFEIFSFLITNILLP